MIKPNWLSPWILISVVFAFIAVKTTWLEEIRLIAVCVVFTLGWVGGQLAQLRAASPPRTERPPQPDHERKE